METTVTQAPQPALLFRGEPLNISDDYPHYLVFVTAQTREDKFQPSFVGLLGNRHMERTRMAPDKARNLAQQLIAAANACDALEDKEAREQASADDVEGVPV